MAPTREKQAFKILPFFQEKLLDAVQKPQKLV